MSLTAVLETPEARAFLKSRIARPAHFTVPKVRVPAAGANPWLLGIAFDYAFRLGLAARHTCEEQSWVAEGAAGRLRLQRSDHDAARAEAVLAEASDTLADFGPDQELAGAHARACYLLSGLDLVVRPGCVDHVGVEPSEADLDELTALYGVVPWAQFAPQRRLVLNPTFGDGSRLVGGGDADIVLDDLLIDLKTSRNTGLVTRDLRQIVGYALLANSYRVDSKLPQEPIKQVALYQARAAALTAWPLSEICRPQCQLEIIDYLRGP